jgi:IS30 family transposase
MWVSTETIYQSLYVQSRGALKRELTRDLRTGRSLRKPGRRAGQRKNRIPDMGGSNENTNGLLRQYFPKGTDFATATEPELDAVADELNQRPRKRLAFANPTEQLAELLLQ